MLFTASFLCVEVGGVPGALIFELTGSVLVGKRLVFEKEGGPFYWISKK